MVKHNNIKLLHRGKIYYKTHLSNDHCDCIGKNDAIVAVHSGKICKNPSIVQVRNGEKRSDPTKYMLNGVITRAIGVLYYYNSPIAPNDTPLY